MSARRRLPFPLKTVALYVDAFGRSSRVWRRLAAESAERQRRYAEGKLP